METDNQNELDFTITVNEDFSDCEDDVQRSGWDETDSCSSVSNAASTIQEPQVYCDIAVEGVDLDSVKPQITTDMNYVIECVQTCDDDNDDSGGHYGNDVYDAQVTPRNDNKTEFPVIKIEALSPKYLEVQTDNFDNQHDTFYVESCNVLSQPVKQVHDVEEYSVCYSENYDEWHNGNNSNRDAYNSKFGWQLMKPQVTIENDLEDQGSGMNNVNVFRVNVSHDSINYDKLYISDEAPESNCNDTTAADLTEKVEIIGPDGISSKKSSELQNNRSSVAKAVRIEPLTQFTEAESQNSRSAVNPNEESFSNSDVEVNESYNFKTTSVSNEDKQTESKKRLRKKLESGKGMKIKSSTKGKQLDTQSSSRFWYVCKFCNEKFCDVNVFCNHARLHPEFTSPTIYAKSYPKIEKVDVDPNLLKCRYSIIMKKLQAPSKNVQNDKNLKKPQDKDNAHAEPMVLVKNVNAKKADATTESTCSPKSKKKVDKFKRGAIEYFTCEKCKKKFYNQYHLSSHRIYCKGEKATAMAQCGICGVLVPTSEEYTHVRSHQTVCQICGKICRTIRALKMHFNVEHGTKSRSDPEKGKNTKQKFNDLETKLQPKNGKRGRPVKKFKIKAKVMKVQKNDQSEVSTKAEGHVDVTNESLCENQEGLEIARDCVKDEMIPDSYTVKESQIKSSKQSQSHSGITKSTMNKQQTELNKNELSYKSTNQYNMRRRSPKSTVKCLRRPIKVQK